MRSQANLLFNQQLSSIKIITIQQRNVCFLGSMVIVTTVKALVRWKGAL